MHRYPLIEEVFTPLTTSEHFALIGWFAAVVLQNIEKLAFMTYNSMAAQERSLLYDLLHNFAQESLENRGIKKALRLIIHKEA